MCSEMHGALLRGLVAVAGLVLAESVGASRSSEPAGSFRRIEEKASSQASGSLRGLQETSGILRGKTSLQAFVPPEYSK